MRVKCTAIIDNPDEMAKFARQVKNMGFKPIITKNTIVVEYIGYNKTKYDLLTSLIEQQTRHKIETHND